MRVFFKKTRQGAGVQPHSCRSPVCPPPLPPRILQSDLVVGNNRIMHRREFVVLPAAAITAPALSEVMRTAVPVFIGATVPAIWALPLTPETKEPLNPPLDPNLPRKSVTEA